jgi:hypothetical protein
MARIVGKNAALYLGASPVKVGDIFDWTFEATVENVPCSIKMDAYERFIPSFGTARLTAQRYVNTRTLLLNETLDAISNAEQQTFRLDLVDASGSFSQISGTGYINRAALAAPRGMVVDDFELVVDGIWAITTPGSA